MVYKVEDVLYAGRPAQGGEPQRSLVPARAMNANAPDGKEQEALVYATPALGLAAIHAVKPCCTTRNEILISSDSSIPAMIITGGFKGRPNSDVHVLPREKFIKPTAGFEWVSKEEVPIIDTLPIRSWRDLEGLQVARGLQLKLLVISGDAGEWFRQYDEKRQCGSHRSFINDSIENGTLKEIAPRELSTQFDGQNCVVFSSKPQTRNSSVEAKPQSNSMPLFT